MLLHQPLPCTYAVVCAWAIEHAALHIICDNQADPWLIILSNVCEVLSCTHTVDSSRPAAAAADTLIALEIFAYNFVEIKRWQDFKKPGSQSEKGSFVGLEGFFQGSGENGYPGGIFDPLGLSKCASNPLLHGLCPPRP